MIYFVYAIKSKVDGRIYVGFSEDVQRRLKEHNSGKTKSTKGYRPWEMIFTEECNQEFVQGNLKNIIKVEVERKN